jgi:hypothetical protein
MRYVKVTIEICGRVIVGFTPIDNAEGETAPETLRQTDRISNDPLSLRVIPVTLESSCGKYPHSPTE